ncbi:hypothetical protein N7512_008266 [Penicillium capsulatum]|nr:hypothetical protein N7512_008266 [Penicillium capsulatum]
MPGSCLSLSGSKACPAWGSASISTDSSQLNQFYADLLGCQGLNTSALNDYYAQYTTSVICSSLIQNSISDCSLSGKQAEPLCAESCALKATSEERIIINSDLCSSIDKKTDYMGLIRSRFEICAHPTDSLTGNCVDGSTNEPDNCGFASNTMGLCTYCDSSASSSSDTCCAASNAASKCDGVSIPTPTVTLQPISTSDAAAADAGTAGHGLSGGQIAGIVIGSVAGAAILVALAALLLICRRRRRAQQTDAALNQPNPQRKGSSPPMQQMDSPQAYNMVPAMFASAKYSDSSDSEGFGASPGAMSKRIAPVAGKRHGSLSSSSALAGLDSDSSPQSGTVNQYSSPEGVTSGQSEQLSYFRDYYSQDDIQAGDKVAVLWAYSPRAGDEFELDRGEMLKVIGIWDDGWATGVRLGERAEDYDISHREQRDSGVSSGSQRPGPSPAPSGEIKAFPLVCICLPQHWRKIIDGSVQEDEDEF